MDFRSNVQSHGILRELARFVRTPSMCRNDSATTTSKCSSKSIHLTELQPFLFWLTSISCGGHLESCWLQRYIYIYIYILGYFGNRPFTFRWQAIKLITAKLVGMISDFIQQTSDESRKQTLLMCPIFVSWCYDRNGLFVRTKQTFIELTVCESPLWWLRPLCPSASVWMCSLSVGSPPLCTWRYEDTWVKRWETHLSYFQWVQQWANNGERAAEPTAFNNSSECSRGTSAAVVRQHCQTYMGESNHPLI